MNDKKIRVIALFGAILCFLAVAIGAFGAHAFKDLLIENQRQGVFELANRYQFYHGLGMLLIAALFSDVQRKLKLEIVGGLMFSGAIVFSGSLYLLATLNVAWLGAVAPIGGTMMLGSWAMLVIMILKFKSQ